MSRKLEARKAFRIIIFILTAVFLFWRLHYGAADAFACPDEAFYLSLPYRMYFGDLLFYDEIHVTQLMAFLVYPLIKIWLIITDGNTEGIILAFRYVWFILHIVVSLFVYYFVSRKNKNAAIFSSVLYLLSVPYNIYALSYNTIQMGCMMIFLASYLCVSGEKWIDYLRGILLAAAVLCNPFNVLVYISILILAVINRRKKIDSQLETGNILRMHAGICIMLAIFICYYAVSMSARSISISEFILNLKNIIQSDQTRHVNISLYSFFLNKINFAIQFQEMFPLFLPVFAAAVISGKADKRFTIAAFWFCVLMSIGYALYCSVFQRNNVVLLFPSFIGAAVLILRKKELQVNSVVCLIIFSVFMVCVDLCSDMQLAAIAWASVPGGVISVFLLGQICEEDIKNIERSKKLKKLTKSIYWALCLMLLAVFTIHHAYVFHDAGFSELNTKIERGPLRGIITCEDRDNYYNAVLDVYDSVELKDDDKVLTFPTWGLDVLIVGRECCSPSTWYYPSSSDFGEGGYYSSHPDKMPTVVFVNNDVTNKAEYWNFTEWLEENWVLEKTIGAYSIFKNVGKFS